MMLPTFRECARFLGKAARDVRDGLLDGAHSMAEFIAEGFDKIWYG
jgi:hypothetical protein